MERALGGFERALWIQDRIGCSNSVIVARLDGPLSDSALRRALRKLQKRHPLLSVHIATPDGESSPKFVSAGTPAIDVRVVDRMRRAQREAGWHTQTEYELNTPFDTATGPLVRVVSIRPPEIGSGQAEESGTNCDLILTVHAAIGDVAAGEQPLDDLLRSLAGTGADTTLPERRALDDLIPADSKKTPKGFGGWLKKAQRFEPDSFVPPTERVTRVINGQLKPEEVESLIARCRREQTTVHGALCAALASELDRDIVSRGGKRPTIPCGSVVNLRAHVDAGGEDLGVLSSTLCTYHQASGLSFWDMARDAKKQLRDAMARGDAFAVVRQLATLAPSGAGESSRFAEQVDKRDASNVAIHNVGALPIAEKVGAFTVRKLQFASAVPFYEHMRIAVATHGGWLTWNLLYVEREVGDERAKRIADNCIASLREAASA